LVDHPLLHHHVPPDGSLPHHLVVGVHHHPAISADRDADDVADEELQHAPREGRAGNEDDHHEAEHQAEGLHCEEGEGQAAAFLLDSVDEGRAGDDLANVHQFHHDHDHLEDDDISLGELHEEVGGTHGSLIMCDELVPMRLYHFFLQSIVFPEGRVEGVCHGEDAPHDDQPRQGHDQTADQVDDGDDLGAGLQFSTHSAGFI